MKLLKDKQGRQLARWDGKVLYDTDPSTVPYISEGNKLIVHPDYGHMGNDGNILYDVSEGNPVYARPASPYNPSNTDEDLYGGYDIYDDQPAPKPMPDELSAKCEHCGTWGKPRTACERCGAPMPKEANQ